MLSIIAAISENNVIGKDNRMIWHLPADLERFKQITTGHVLIMGRKTFESLGSVLPERKHVVLTRDMSYYVENENVEIVHDLSEVEKYINGEDECFLIGGAIMYRQLMPKVQKMYITRVHEKFDGDAYFPVIKNDEWEVVEKVQGEKDTQNPYDFEFITYVKKEA